MRALPAPPATVTLETDADVVARYLEDAAHYPGGRAMAVARPHDVAETAAVVRDATRLLPVGAQSSLTGGATPVDAVVLSTERLTTCRLDGEAVIAGAGLSLLALQEHLATHDLWFPPVPTFLGATVGGAVSTNAAGAATFKYGPVRKWVDGLTVVLADGAVLSIERGEVVAAPGDTIAIDTASGSARVTLPRLRTPHVPKCSAGYFSAEAIDLVDLFIGAEGTLGVITDARLRAARRPAGVCWALVPLRDEEAAIRLTADLRAAAQRTWQTRDPGGLDVAAIEHIDRRSLEIARSEGIDERLNVRIPPDTGVVLLAQIELRDGAIDWWREVAEFESAAASGPIAGFCRILQAHDALEATEIAPSGARAAAFVDFREGIPSAVNRCIARARDQVDARIHKTAADMIVPFDRFGEMMRLCRDRFAERQLDLAVWGHISDGNVHPNVIPRSFADVERGRDAILALGRAVVEMGGSPLAEHGVGRNPVKQQLLRLLHGAAGIEAMRWVKRSLDPQWKLAPGVLFPVAERDEAMIV